MWNNKAQTFTVQMLIARLMFLKKNRWNSKVKVILDIKPVGTHGKVLPLEILMWNIKALTFSVQKSFARLKFQQIYRMKEWQMDRMTKKTKTICHPIFDLVGIKIKILIFRSLWLCLNAEIPVWYEKQNLLCLNRFIFAMKHKNAICRRNSFVLLKLSLKKIWASIHRP